MPKQDMSIDRVLKASKRLSHLRPVKVEDGELIGPRCKDGVGRYGFDMDGQNGRDLVLIINALPEILDILNR